MHRRKPKLEVRTWLIAAMLLFALPVTVLAWAFPRASRVAIYQSELSNPAILDALSGVFTIEQPRSANADDHTFLIDLGYAQISLDDEPLSVLQLRPGLVEIKTKPGRIIAFAPFLWKGRNGVWDPIVGVIGAGENPALDPFSGMGEDFDLGPTFQGAAGFEWNASAVRTLPVTMPGIWSMTDDEFGRFYLRTLFKAMDTTNEAGGWIIRTRKAESIVRFGALQRPGRVHIAAWSRQGDLTHGLLVDSDSPDWSRQTAGAIASSWTPMIEEAPRNAQELERLINRGINWRQREPDGAASPDNAEPNLFPHTNPPRL